MIADYKVKVPIIGYALFTVYSARSKDEAILYAVEQLQKADSVTLTDFVAEDWIGRHESDDTGSMFEENFEAEATRVEDKQE